MSICLGNFISKGKCGADFLVKAANMLASELNIQIDHRMDILLCDGEVVLIEDIKDNIDLVEVIESRYRKVSCGSFSRRDFIISQKHNIYILHRLTTPNNISEVESVKLIHMMRDKILELPDIVCYDAYLNKMEVQNRKLSYFSNFDDEYVISHNKMETSSIKLVTNISGIDISEEIVDLDDRVKELINIVNFAGDSIDEDIINSDDYNSLLENLNHLYTILNFKKINNR